MAEPIRRWKHTNDGHWVSEESGGLEGQINQTGHPEQLVDSWGNETRTPVVELKHPRAKTGALGDGTSTGGSGAGGSHSGKHYFQKEEHHRGHKDHRGASQAGHRRHTS